MVKLESNERKLYLNHNLQLIFGITLMAVMGVSLITPAFPDLARHFGVSQEATGLLITVFTLPGVLLTPVLGVLADRFGRKRILVPSLLLFGLAGGACIWAQTFETLLILRFLQGAGAASLGALNLTLIGDLFKGIDRVSAMGINASVLSVGTAIYPALGGALAGLAWYYPFSLFALSIPLAGLVYRYLDKIEVQANGDMKAYFKGIYLGLKDSKLLLLLTASAMTFIILYGSYLAFFPLFLADKFGAGPLEIGLLLSSMSVSTAVTSSQLGRLYARYSPRRMLLTAYSLYVLALALIIVIPEFWFLLFATLIFGIGHGLNIPTLQNFIATLAPAQFRGAFMSANGLVLRLGQTLGPLLMGVASGLWGLSAPFISGAGVALVLVLAFAGFSMQKNQQS